MFAADATVAPSMSNWADGVLLTPSVAHPGYLTTLLSFCSRKCVSLLVPLGDPELIPLSRATARGRFSALGTTVVVSAEAMIRCCLDRWVTYEYLYTRQIPTPQTYLSLVAACDALLEGALAFPVVVKSRWRTAACAPEVCYDERELELAYRRAQRRLARSAGADGRRVHLTLIQEFVGGAEYGFDVLNDPRGSYGATFARKKLGVRAGETDSALTTDAAVLGGLPVKIAVNLAHCGSLEGDALVAETGTRVIDLKPRVGDGYAFSRVAGANLPAVLLAWAKGEMPDNAWLRPEPNVTAARYSGVMRLSAESGLSDA